MVSRADALAKIDNDLGRLPEVRSVCVAIVDFLAHQEVQIIERVTFGQIKRIAGLDDVANVIPAVEYLTGARLHLLEPRFEFVDQTNDFVEEVSLDVVAEARAQSVFYHPQSGEEVKDFEHSLFMFFVISGEARDLGRAP